MTWCSSLGSVVWSDYKCFYHLDGMGYFSITESPSPPHLIFQHPFIVTPVRDNENKMSFPRNPDGQTSNKITWSDNKCANRLWPKCPTKIVTVINTLRLVNLAGHILLCGELKINVKLFLLPKCCMVYRQVSITFIASNSLKLSFTFNQSINLYFSLSP